MLKNSEIAIETDKANEQHYELPTAFFRRSSVKRLKYKARVSFEHADTTLDQARRSALACYCQRAQLKDGQDILEIGCGWGSFSLYMASIIPTARITVVSNSSTQREYIQEQARLKTG